MNAGQGQNEPVIDLTMFDDAAHFSKVMKATLGEVPKHLAYIACSEQEFSRFKLGALTALLVAVERQARQEINDAGYGRYWRLIADLKKLIVKTQKQVDQDDLHDADRISKMAELYNPDLEK